MKNAEYQWETRQEISADVGMMDGALPEVHGMQASTCISCK